MNDEIKQDNMSNNENKCDDECSHGCSCEHEHNNEDDTESKSNKSNGEDLIKKERDEYLAGWQRCKADFINYKKSEEERLKNLTNFINANLALQILPIADNFYAAEKTIPEELKTDEHVKGMLQIRGQITDFLKSLDIEEIKAVGEKFNPEFHEAIEMVEDNTKESGIIIEEMQKGYMSEGHVVRPAKVKVVK